MKSRENTLEQLKEDLRKTREELAVQTWGTEKTLGGMKLLVKEFIQKGKEIEKAKAKDEAILANIGDGLIVIDETGRIIIANQVIQDLLGYKISELVGNLFAQKTAMEDEKGNSIPPELQPVQIALTTGQKTTTTSTYYFVRKDKTKFPVAITVSPIILDNKIIGAVEVFRDITREKEVDRMKTEFLSVATHQLRTPLGSMRWNLEMLLGGDYGTISAENKTAVTQIYESNIRLITLVNDLLNVSRIDQGKVEDNPVATDMVKIIEDELKEIDIEIKKRKLTLHLDRGKKIVPQIVVDPKRFREVIANLLSNAIKYNHVGGTVEVSIAILDHTVEIRVADTGMGIPPKDQARLFSKFYRAENAVKSETEGSGLGLFVVKSYIEKWGGRVSFESTEGKGTTFTITLPVQEQK